MWFYCYYYYYCNCVNAFDCCLFTHTHMRERVDVCIVAICVCHHFQMDSAENDWVKFSFGIYRKHMYKARSHIGTLTQFNGYNKINQMVMCSSIEMVYWGRWVCVRACCANSIEQMKQTKENQLISFRMRAHFTHWRAIDADVISHSVLSFFSSSFSFSFALKSNDKIVFFAFDYYHKPRQTKRKPTFIWITNVEAFYCAPPNNIKITITNPKMDHRWPGLASTFICSPA